MKRTLITITLSLVMLFGVFSSSALGQRRRGHHGNRCQMQYNIAVRQANRLRGPARRVRLAEARREYNECRRHR